jgi:hypothetical protein
MTLKTLCLFAAPLGAAALTVASVMGAPAAGLVTFEPHVIANSLRVREVGWYENPTWQRHTIVPEMRRTMQRRANGCISEWKTAPG